SGETQVVTIGRIRDTVKPRLSVLTPADKDIVTAGKSLRAVVSIEDIGTNIEEVEMYWRREYQGNAGQWLVLDETPLQLFRNDERPDDDKTPKSDPDNNYYVYWADFSDGNILRRTGKRNERLRVTTKVVTKNHTVKDETVYEVGHNISERRFLAPSGNNQQAGRTVYYTAVDQYKAVDREGAMVTAWSTVDPSRLERELLGNKKVEQNQLYMRTGLFILDAVDEKDTGGTGDVFIYSRLLNGAAEIFSGAITEIKADTNIVLASKAGVADGVTPVDGTDSFVGALETEIRRDWLGGDTGAEGSGELYYRNHSGELLLFNHQNGEGQFGLPYLLSGRIDMPYPDVYGLDRKDDLALVANGHGGVQVIDISSFASPYHVGYIKPNGFTRDVKIKGNYAYIAASHEGVVVANISEPTLPVIRSVDTIGIANRLTIQGDKLYVTNMSGDGEISQVDIFDISQPVQPKLLRSIELTPAREDYVQDGVYDVSVTGNFAYASVHYSDQEDKPSQTIVEMIDLAKVAEPATDATVPAVIHRDASWDDFSVRDLTFARGAVQVAAGKQGINRIDISELTVLKHKPYYDQADVNTKLERIVLELSAVLPEDTDLSDHIRVVEGDLKIGVDVTDKFEPAFKPRKDSVTYKVVHLNLKDGEQLRANTRYFVIVKAGLSAVTGYPLARDYSFGFITSAAGAEAAPDITSICAVLEDKSGSNACISSGDIQGGTSVVISGYHFSDEPSLSIGGLRLGIDKVELNGEDGLDRIFAKTQANNAGPAAVSVTNKHGLTDIVLGGFTYVDQLSVSFVTPAVVSTVQAGRNDKVSIVGYGFHPKVQIKAYKSGTPEIAVTDRVDGDRLKLYSAERMNWVVPDFTDGSGESYRGFIDIEVTDDRGRVFRLPNALFYGKLEIVRTIQTEHSFTRGFIQSELDKLSRNELRDYVPDAGKLPPGQIAALEKDESLNILYVLGRGLRDQSGLEPGQVFESSEIQHFYPPGWISLVKYKTDALPDAAPKHGLGYYNLPQDLVPTDMVLSGQHLYVTASGYKFPHIDTPHDGRQVLLVYDREIRDPDDLTEQPPGKDRDILYTLPLPVEHPPERVIAKDDLLFIGAKSSGVVVINVADPLRPTVVKKLESAQLQGRGHVLNVRDIALVGDTLHVISRSSSGYSRFVFDIRRTSLPQLNVIGSHTNTAVLTGDTHFSSGHSVALFDAENPEFIRAEGRYQANGFKVPGDSFGLDAQATVVVNLTRKCAGKENRGKCEGIHFHQYLGLYDVSRSSDISLLDAMTRRQLDVQPPPNGYPKDVFWQRDPLLLTDEGVVAYAIAVQENSKVFSVLNFVDTQVLDLVSSQPEANSRAVHLDTPLVLTFNRAVSVEKDALEKYVAFFQDNGSQEKVKVAVQYELSADKKSLRLLPEEQLTANSGYQIVLKGELDSRRTRGLFDHTLSFRTGQATGDAVSIEAISPRQIETSGGEVLITLAHATGTPSFRFAGEPGVVLESLPLDNGQTQFRVKAPANTIP
ncbi:MAG: Ig-like domain-containing protein, partial [Endozoicomonas sp.]